MDQQFWENLYGSRGQVFSGAPNGVLVKEIADLPPGRALDVGCGEGADALWLARRGWHVTAVDISPTALERAARSAAAVTDLPGSVTCVHADLTSAPPPAGPFDLVTVQYFPLKHEPDHAALHRLLDAVAPAGTLLFVSHDPADLTSRHDIDASDYYQPDDIARQLDERWTVVSNERRPRTAPAPPGTPHTHDTVLRASSAPTGTAAR